MVSNQGGRFLDEIPSQGFILAADESIRRCVSLKLIRNRAPKDEKPPPKAKRAGKKHALRSNSTIPNTVLVRVDGELLAGEK